MSFEAPASQALEGVGLSCLRGSRRLFDRLDLTLNPGRLAWLRADNGRGKTSLLRLLAGVVEPNAGKVCLGGRSLRDAARSGLRPVYIGHASALKDDLSATEALGFLACLHERPHASPQAVRNALSRLGLERITERPVRTLSQGQRRRVALARLALEEKPLPWILDEPFDALDDKSAQQLEDLICEHLDRGGSVVLTSHRALSPKAPHAQTWRLSREGLVCEP